jgi:hypothetical protein
MSYKLSYRRKRIDIVEIDTGHIVFSTHNKKEAIFTIKQFSKGRGFAGHTPLFMLNTSFKKVLDNISEM